MSPHRDALLLCLAALLTAAPARAADPPPALKVLIVIDMEGATAATSPKHPLAHNAAEYAEARRSLTEDVNAAVRGLVAAGATDVVIVDGHGSGNSKEPDVVEAELLAPARMISRERRFDPYLESLDHSVDAVCAVGMHAGAGNEAGFMRHTLTLEARRWEVNGIPFDESMILAVSAARLKIPLVMVSGDDRLERELERMLPWVRYARVKRAVDRRHAEPVERAEASRRIEVAAREGLADRARAGLPPWGPPYRFAVTFQDEQQAELAALVPGAAAGEDGVTVTYRAGDFAEGYTAVRRMLHLAATATWAWAGFELVESRPDAEELRTRLFDRVLSRWLDDPPAAQAAGTQGTERFWGVR